MDDWTLPPLCLLHYDASIKPLVYSYETEFRMRQLNSEKGVFIHHNVTKIRAKFFYGKD